MTNPELTIVCNTRFDLGVPPNKLNTLIEVELDNIPDNATPLRVFQFEEFYHDLALTYMYKQNLIIKPIKRILYFVRDNVEFNPTNKYYLCSINTDYNWHCFVDADFMLAGKKDYE